ncbi:MAG: NADH-quinone oxidoreductase subunit L [Hyphomonadaceae bacterium]|nr:MAG: NADH-quinone oxidoreductase subunit L [Hyphomonadaceae bacterium]
MSVEVLAQIVVFAPVIGAILAGLFGAKMPVKLSMAITTGLLFVSFFAAAAIFLGYHQHTIHLPEAPIQFFKWLDVAGFTSTWSIRIDAISVVMMFVVTSVSSLVHLYSWGYMAEDPHKPRFFAYLSLFTFAMLALVTAADFMQLFFGWEGVGLASYLLIGFWHQKRSANDAQIKAFIVNRIGDFGFVLGIMSVYMVFGTIEFKPVFAAIPSHVNDMMQWGIYSLPTMEVIGVLLFIGAMGKSAQFFLHTWLPDAMEGPTPVSALIHAATMVTAGVVLVCICSPIYEVTTFASGMITLVGAVTAIFAASVGLAQNDIKRVIAYSTCSQLGYMFFAAGIGAYQAAMFHLFTHAFFKALLFLGAGSVIHGLHHQQDMRQMGAVAKPMPLTYAMMMIGTLSITGVGIPQTQFGLSGFFSKDAIIETTFAASVNGAPFATFAFWISILAALLTSFYSWRLAFMTFHGSYKGEAHGHHGDHHEAHAAKPHTAPAHESPLSMLIPLGLLAFGAVFAGFFFADAFVGHHNAEFWGSAIFNAPTNHVLDERHHIATWVLYMPLIVTVTGLLAAIFIYLMNEGMGKKIAKAGGFIHAFLFNKWYFDEIYEVVFVKSARAIGDFLWKIGDGKIIDGMGPNGISHDINVISKKSVKMQTGYVYHYAFIMLVAVLGFGALIIFRKGL